MFSTRRKKVSVCKMNLYVVAAKSGWRESESGYVTVGGFPFQMQAISNLFSETKVMLLMCPLPASAGAQKLIGNHLTVFPLPEPNGADFRRKLSLLAWLPRYFSSIWREIQKADAVHAPVPGDIGFIGILIALLQRKPLFVRHCGTWGEPVTLSDKVLLWLLERIAGGRNVVLATGGADLPPSTKNRHIHWIFATSLTEQEMSDVSVARAWRQGETLRLINVGRLSSDKNTAAVIQALVHVQKEYPDVHLSIVGDGEQRSALEKLAMDMGLTDKVTFHGNVSHLEVLRLLSSAHLFVFPTRNKEGFPKALLEAMACGLPLVATNVSVIPCLIRECGILLSDTGPETVANAVLRLIQDEKGMQAMAIHARQAAQKYTLEQWQEQIRSHLESAWGPLQKG